ncbi:MAG: hypothetical protein D6725_06675 [Planctomycetota bacterium]|nr:MAG: hypothetical protein D6725_06675 [Planctomycetota bacterium]
MAAPTAEPEAEGQAAEADTKWNDSVATAVDATDPDRPDVFAATVAAESAASGAPVTSTVSADDDEEIVAAVVDEHEPASDATRVSVSDVVPDASSSIAGPQAERERGRGKRRAAPDDADPVPDFSPRRRKGYAKGKASAKGRSPSGEKRSVPKAAAAPVAVAEPEQEAAVAVAIEPIADDEEELEVAPEIAAQIPAEEDDLLLLEREKSPEQIWKERVDAAKVFAINTLLHAAVLLIFAFIVLPEQTRETFRMITSSMEEDIEEVIEQEDLTIEEPEEISEIPPAEIVNDLITDSPDNVNLDISDFEPSMDLPDTLSDAPGLNAPIKGEMAGRSKAGRSALVAKYGGTAASEAAVERGIKWLIRHQLPDGSWSYDHRVQGCGTVCTRPGTLKNSYMGATAMAVLAALGAGHTHVSGDYQPAIKKAIGYMLANAKRTGAGLDMRGANEANSGMYIQGLVATALCECYNMSKYVLEENKNARDSKARAQRRVAFQAMKTLKEAAEGSILFIINAQDPVGGGWRYRPRQPGDTSVVGWQVMALVSAKYADIPVPSSTIMGVNRFLNFVQADDGAQYGYTGPATGRHSTTSIGLLCRMYLGWRRENDALRRGVEFLSRKGPSKTDMYYNYYATQVMHQYGGEPWKKWNAQMRDYLVKTQDKNGHAAGSWGFIGPHADKGGRLMTTTLAIMTLEVYYRHMPLYQHELESDKPKSKTAKRPR